MKHTCAAALQTFDELMQTEEAIETAGGLVAVLNHLREVTTAAERDQLNEPIGFVLNAISHELQTAKESYTRAFRRATCATCDQFEGRK